MDREIKLKGDKVIAQIPSIKDKVRINLNENIWDFAEIGAGQETVRHFFRWWFIWYNSKSNVCL
jgi:hypothetical protein